MNFARKTLLAVACITACFAVTSACGSHDHNYSELCVDAANTAQVDEEYPHGFNGLAGPDIHGRRAEARMVVGDVDFTTFGAFADSGARCKAPKPTVADEAETLEVVDKWVKRMGDRRHLQQTVDIPVYFHIITYGSQGSVSQNQLNDQINVLNRAYAPLFQFREAAAASRSNSRSWFFSTLGSSAEASMKRSLRQGGENALNIYTASPGGGVLGMYDRTKRERKQVPCSGRVQMVIPIDKLIVYVRTTNPFLNLFFCSGWATFPRGVSFDQEDDGIVLRYDTLPGGSLFPYNEGDTGTHEVGHWLGLYHTFQNGCGSNTASNGDYITDTPAEREPAYGCPIGRDVSTSGSRRVLLFSLFQV
jgi:hypothetical protein